MYRHGDVYLKKGTVPDKAVKLDHLVLAEGEVTGHAHRISEGDADLYEKDGKIYLSVKSETAALTHEEHSKIDLPKGDYEIGIQQEYEPEGWRNVVD